MLAVADLYIAVGSFVLVLAIIPNVLGRVVVPYRSCLVTATVLTSWVPIYAIIGLHITAVSLSLSAIGWWLLVRIRVRDGG